MPISLNGGPRKWIGTKNVRVLIEFTVRVGNYHDELMKDRCISGMGSGD